MNFEVLEETLDFVTIKPKGYLNLDDVQWMYDNLSYIYLSTNHDGIVLCKKEPAHEYL